MYFDINNKWPKYIDIKQSKILQAWLWAFTNVFIPKNTKIWEYIWKKMLPNDFDNKYSNTDYWFSVRKWHKVLFVIDAANKKFSNWTRYINCPRNKVEENVKFFQYKQKIFVKSLRDIMPWEELLVWYGYEYGEKLLWYNIYD